MSTLMTMLVIIVVLFVCVGGIAVIHKREKEKEALRQQIAKYRYRANQASTALSNVEQLPIGLETRKAILQYVKGNLLMIKKLAANDLANNNNLEAIQKAMEATDNPYDKQKLVIPGDMDQLKLQINQLSSLAKFVKKVSASPAVDSAIAAASINKVMALVAELKICAFIQQGQNSLTKHEYVKAQRFFTMSQDMLDRITNKNPRLQQLESDLADLVKSSAIDAHKTDLTFNETEAPAADESDEQDTGDDLFGPKKKW